MFTMATEGGSWPADRLGWGCGGGGRGKGEGRGAAVSNLFHLFPF